MSPSLITPTNISLQPFKDLSAFQALILYRALASVLFRELESGYYYRELNSQLPSSAALAEGTVEPGCDGGDGDGDDLFQDLRLGFDRIGIMFSVLWVGAALAALFLFAERVAMPRGREDVFSEERRKQFRWLFFLSVKGIHIQH